jgi:hypothetical protein
MWHAWGRGEGHTGFWLGKLEGEMELGCPWYRLEGNIKMKHQEIEWGAVVDWIVVAQNRDKWRAIVNVVMNFLL